MILGMWSRKSTAEAAKEPPKEAGPIRAQWRKFRELVCEPWTCLLLIASIGLFAVGQQKGLSGGVSALLQVLLAVVTGVLGARVTNLVSEASGEGIIVARGKVAVRGLKLMLVQTAAFERRLRRFVAAKDHIDSHPEVTKRNYEEAIEFCRRIQEEAASAMETWGDVVPSADLSSLIGRITEAEEQRDASSRELEKAKSELQQAAENTEDAERMRSRIAFLEMQVKQSDRRVAKLTDRLESRALSGNFRRRNVPVGPDSTTSPSYVDYLAYTDHPGEVGVAVGNSLPGDNPPSERVS